MVCIPVDMLLGLFLGGRENVVGVLHCTFVAGGNRVICDSIHIEIWGSCCGPILGQCVDLL